jgi:transcription initiation factor TFIIB
MACQSNDDRRVQREIAEAAGTTEVTLRNRYKGLKEAIDEMPTPESIDPITKYN